jgi:hypothetical protein
MKEKVYEKVMDETEKKKKRGWGERKDEGKVDKAR